MEILILTGKFGMGHWSAALSLQEQLERDGHHAQVIDFFDYAMPDIAPALYRGFNLLVTYGGGIYNLFHRMTRNTPGEVPLAGQFTRRLAMLLDEVRPDAVLSTHPVCSGVAARYKAEYGSVLPLITCITDVTAHSEWLHPGTDCYLVPSASVRDALRAKGVDPSRAAVTGIPVTAETYKRPKPTENPALAPYFAWKGGIDCTRSEEVGESLFGPQLGQRACGLIEKLIPMYDYFNQITASNG